MKIGIKFHIRYLGKYSKLVKIASGSDLGGVTQFGSISVGGSRLVFSDYEIL